jgi:hypothetical protein
MKKIIFCVVLLSSCILSEYGVSGNNISDGSSSIAPPESPAPVAFYNMGLPPEGWTSGTLWVIAVHDTKKEGDSSLEIDWVRFYCMVNGRPVIVSGETSSNGTGTFWSGSWPRKPWCRGNENREDMKIDFTENTALLPLNKRPDRVWHFGGKRVVIPNNASSCYSEARFKLTGNALVQLGADFWIDEKSDWCPDHQCNTAAFGSDWFKASDEWIIITAGKP